MYVTVHRGTRQIGGNLIEIGTSQTRMLFDAGANLPPLDGPKTEDSFELKGLTFGESAFDGVFLSHHHNDHCGLLGKLLSGIPVFAGEETKRILNVIADFTDQPRPDINFGFRDGRPLQLDDVRVTPIGVEHSARDAYMFLIQAEGKNVLYTGDFRTSEKAISAVRELLGEGQKLDLLITEGTNIRPGKEERAGEFQGEEMVKRRAAGRMRLYQGTVFVLCSSANEDRIQAISTAAAWAGRTVCEDLFQSAVRNYTDETVRTRTYSGLWPAESGRTAGHGFTLTNCTGKRPWWGRRRWQGSRRKKSFLSAPLCWPFWQSTWMHARRRRNKALCFSILCGRATSKRLR